MKRLLIIGYGIASYLAFVVSFLYAIAFVGNFIVPRTVDSGIAAPMSEAMLVNLLLLFVFAVQHSVMARPAFKRWWTRIVPQAIERSTYVLLSSLALALLYWQWRTMPAVVWNVESTAGRVILWALFWLGWATVFSSTFMINHFDLFGLRQVWLNWRDQPYRELGFQQVMLYRVIRHPIMAGFIVAFWATPTMTAGHLLFAGVSTAYVLAAIQLEEHDMVVNLGDQYRDYRHRVAMLIPGLHLGHESPTPEIRHRPA
ncbi:MULTISPECIES: methanethiol S-methyltransferase [unclassified Mycolicibacterium]|uniref:methanethiol S-methyltransferase n=1 Tax=unclassified Mycolicibacterium TaxID=2636767 RepID=UPI0012DF9296|nr:MULTISPECIES: methanethiol S-methyltransferase [unclassified Mycolicibacterium]MUL81700.1 isoprenylcysteine carboxylmethyltransferase family protein [Mycolicibacterium sp. CBMA 329]MUL87466.1 isoprenylcysteine carboxylmethyltransferase family protein [Mycolicibacterium sp. CBMA 331]MUL99669.1 isoprenylcysteine carboxylmethyltransferase family protein [Mycolicibacterium sp. CBMA 334]MUM28255.1 isoprenylcysteine carboxylmethyltransferase family protein [Mycolicibacterium sp. CBMA 295]MUM37763